jgi:hypothetical protein
VHCRLTDSLAPAQSSPASQQSGDGGLPGKKIALDLQLPDLAVQIVDHLLRILGRRRLAAARKQLPARKSGRC